MSFLILYILMKIDAPMIVIVAWFLMFLYKLNAFLTKVEKRLQESDE